MIIWLDEINQEAIGSVGGKAINLGELKKLLPNLVPAGFVITTEAFFQFLENNQLKKRIGDILAQTNINNPEELKQAADTIQELIIKGKIPPKIATAITSAYQRLGGLLGLKRAVVAVRSSATAEDLPQASFAGQQETFLGVWGQNVLLEKVKACWASLFTARAIFYRQENKIEQTKVGLAVIVQKLVPAEISGVMFTVDPLTNQKNQIVIEAIWGLGEYLVQGKVIPDTYWIKMPEARIVKKIIRPQRIQLMRRGKRVLRVFVPTPKRKIAKLSSAQIVELAQIGFKIHRHYFFPQDIEWAYANGQFWILQTRPVTTVKKVAAFRAKTVKLDPTELVLEGEGASPGIGEGKVILIKNKKEIGKVKRGWVLVAPMTSPDFVPAMKKAAAIVTDRGGQTSHAAIVSRELGVPCVVGTKVATKVLKTGDWIIVDGEKGKIWLGVPKKGKKIKKKTITTKTKVVKTATKIFVNLSEPAVAEEIAKKNVDGVGLLRAEFMIAQIGIHPLLAIKRKRGKEFSQKLAEGILTICRAFNPRPVVYRTTDFKTNEYRTLSGGELFEPKEENPLLGFRGAFRYLAFPQAFQLEIEALRIVRQKAGFKNLWLMIPFVRTPRELLETKRLLADFGLPHSASFKLWLMIEVPSNVLQLRQFLRVGVDGVSIGSNDLTSLILGVDRDNENLASLFDETDPAVLTAIKKVIKTCQKMGVTTSICGQAPSSRPDLVEKLVRWGISSISVNPDAIETVRRIVAKTEKKLIQ